MVTDGAEVPKVRHEVVAHLTSLGVASEMVETAGLLVTELMTNAITHGQAPVRCATSVMAHERRPMVRIEVWDGSDAPPILREPTLYSETGRGLHLIEKLSARWGWEATEHGKVIWCEID